MIEQNFFNLFVTIESEWGMNLLVCTHYFSPSSRWLGYPLDDLGSRDLVERNSNSFGRFKSQTPMFHPCTRLT